MTRSSPPIRTRAGAVALPALLLLVLLGACAPAAGLIPAPELRILDVRLQRLDPPGIGTGAAVIELDVRAANPTPVALRLAGLDGALLLDGVRAADASFRGGADLPARGSAVLDLEVLVPLADAPRLLGELAGLALGEATRVRLDGSLAVDVLGGVRRTPEATLAELTVRNPLRLEPPRARLVSTDVRAQGLGFVVDVAVELENPLPLGYRLRAPSLALSLDGREVARSEGVSVSIPASGSERLTLPFRLDAARVGAALASRLAGGGGGIDLALSGDLALEAPGIASASFDVEGLVRGALR